LKRAILEAPFMSAYQHNKIKTVWDIIRQIENWPTALGLRLRRQHPALRLLNFRSGVNIACRGGTRDWDVVHELFFDGGYGRAMNYLKPLAGQPVVLDLGGNIGLFSLLAAATHPAAEIHAFEPGPPNYRMFELNCLANPRFLERIHLRKEAVAGQTRVTEWFFDELNPGGSGLFNRAGVKYPVQIRSFAEVMAGLPPTIALAKIDIEGSEYELLAGTPPELWNRIQAISLELHDDPAGKSSPAEFLKQMAGAGFKIEQETVVSYFLHR
jgi:FkbM family methyltransferase